MGKIGASRAISRTALALAEGVFAHTVDMSLWFTIYLAQMSIPQSASGQLWRAQIAADRFLRQVNYEAIKNALVSAKKHGWIKHTRHTLPEITEKGRQRLKAVLPQYDEKRIWDGRLHLITYDVPEKRKTDREKLRRCLRQLRCGKLQDSVWITPYNPIDVLRRFIQANNLSGNIIISNLGQDASIGDEDIKALVVRIYDLEALNKKYQDWLGSAEDFGSIDHYLIIQYLAILRDDPQVPFSLLPSWWKGGEAYTRVERNLKMLSI
jgi:CRISPR-associated endonuclease Cas2